MAEKWELTAWDVLINLLERQRAEITKTIDALKVLRPTTEGLASPICEIDLSGAPVLRNLLEDGGIEIVRDYAKG